MILIFIHSFVENVELYHTAEGAERASFVGLDVIRDGIAAVRSAWKAEYAPPPEPMSPGKKK